MMDEISVLDYLKFKLNPKNFGKEILPEDNPVLSGELSAENSGDFDNKKVPGRIESWLAEQKLFKTELNPMFLFLSLIFAIAAQIVLEPNWFARTKVTPWVGSGLYLLCALCFLCSFILKADKDEISQDDLMESQPEIYEELSAESDETEKTDSDNSRSVPVFNDSVRYEFLALSGVCALLAFLLFGGNQFTFINVSVWILAIVFAGLAFSELHLRDLGSKIQCGFQHLSERHFSVHLKLSGWNLLCLAVFACCAFFLFYKLDEVPVDMVSDHAEKLYDIQDILDGKRPIFFTRNTGRECFQFYFTVLIMKLFGTGLSFLSLKIGTALAGLFILPFVYKLGKMLGNRWVGLLAMLFCGVSYWPIVIQRAALRFAYYPMFTAPALYFLIKGLKERSRGNLIWSGIFLGIGLHGYSPFRIIPVAFVIFFVIFLLADVKPGRRTNAMQAFLCLILFAFLVFLPLARVTMDMPEMVITRSVSRLGETEKSFDSSPFGIFADNFWKGIIMPFWSDGSTWVHSIVYRPALEHLTASFFFLGLLFVLMRFIQKRSWEDICMILAIPLFMLPSTLSLAFPAENPCLNRSAGALIPVFLIAAVGFCGVLEVLLYSVRNQRGLLVILCALSIVCINSILSNNFDLIFTRYANAYNRSAWNTKQIGSVINGFNASAGSYEDAYVIPYPHWVDTRLVGINAGDPRRDYSFDKTLVASLPYDGRMRLFIYRESDVEAADAVRMRYPNGIEQLHVGPYNGKNFYSYLAFCTESKGAR